MGFRLFMAGIWGQAGDLNAQFGDNKIVLKKAAPGTFFALFGTVIIVFTLYKGLEFNQNNRFNQIDNSKLEEGINEEEALPDSLPWD